MRTRRDRAAVPPGGVGQKQAVVDDRGLAAREGPAVDGRRVRGELGVVDPPDRVVLVEDRLVVVVDRGQPIY